MQGLDNYNRRWNKNRRKEHADDDNDEHHNGEGEREGGQENDTTNENRIERKFFSHFQISIFNRRNVQNATCA